MQRVHAHTAQGHGHLISELVGPSQRSKARRKKRSQIFSQAFTPTPLLPFPLSLPCPLPFPAALHLRHTHTHATTATLFNQSVLRPRVITHQPQAKRQPLITPSWPSPPPPPPPPLLRTPPPSRPPMPSSSPPTHYTRPSSSPPPLCPVVLSLRSTKIATSSSPPRI